MKATELTGGERKMDYNNNKKRNCMEWGEGETKCGYVYLDSELCS